jgi:branched-chain amino acid transport system substrate-binding protein
MEKIIKVCLIVMLSCILCLTLGVTSSKAEQKEVKIGSCHPFTGPRALPGIEAHTGTVIAADMQNDRGGILGGRKIVLIKGDAKDPEAAASEAERLISTEGVKILMGTYSSSSAAPAHQVAVRHGALYFENIATEDKLTQRGNEYLMRFSSKGSQIGEMIAKFTLDHIAPMYNKKPNDLRMVVFRVNDAWGTAIGGTAVTKSKEVGINVVGDFPYDFSAIDFKSVLLKVRTLNPDILVFNSYVDDGIKLLQGTRDLGLTPKVVMGSGVWASLVKTGEIVGDDTNYLYDIEASYGVNPTHMSAEAKRITAEFERRYKEKFGVDVPSNAYLGFWSAWTAFHQILTKTDKLDTKLIRKIAGELDIPDTETNTGMGVKFAPIGHPDAGHNLRSLSIVRQRFNNNFFVVYPKKFAVMKAQIAPQWGKMAVSAEKIGQWLKERP